MFICRQLLFSKLLKLSKNFRLQVENSTLFSKGRPKPLFNFPAISLLPLTPGKDVDVEFQPEVANIAEKLIDQSRYIYYIFT